MKLRAVVPPNKISRIRSAVTRPNSAVPLTSNTLTALNSQALNTAQIKNLLESRWDEFAKGQQTIDKEVARSLTNQIVSVLLKKEIDQDIFDKCFSVLSFD
jgi:membrane-associated HD superfamily phosphohydrolase